MKYLLNIIVCLIFWNGFSQVFFEKMPRNTRKIHFVYEMKSTYYVQKDRVYADTLIFKLDFPDLKSTNSRHPLDTLKICSFVPLGQFTGENKTKLSSILYHGNETIFGTYDMEKNITTLNCFRDDFKTKELFKNVFNESYEKFEFKIIVDYNKSKIYYNYPNINYEKRFEKINREIKFYDDSRLHGHYFRQTDLYLEDNLVIFDKELDRKINIDLVFTNNKYGLIKHESLFNTVELKSIKYE